MHQNTMRRQQGLHLTLRGAQMHSTTVSTVHRYPSEQQAMYDRWRHEWHSSQHYATGSYGLNTEVEFCMAEAWKQVFA